jgi:hypothetical protein
MGDGDVEMDAVALRPWRVHLLEPDGGELPGGVHEGVGRAIMSWFVGVGEDRLPERPDRRYVESVDGELEHLHGPGQFGGGRAGGASSCCGQGLGDAGGQLGVLRCNGRQATCLQRQLDPVGS